MPQQSTPTWATFAPMPSALRTTPTHAPMVSNPSQLKQARHAPGLMTGHFFSCCIHSRSTRSQAGAKEKTESSIPHARPKLNPSEVGPPTKALTTGTARENHLMVVARELAQSTPAMVTPEQSYIGEYRIIPSIPSHPIHPSLA